MTGADALARPTWRQAVAARPRHVVLAALVLGLLTGPHVDGAALALVALAAGALLVAQRLVAMPAAAALAVLAVVGAGALAQARVAALDRHTLGASIGRTVEATAVLAGAPRPDAEGGGTHATATLRVASGGRGTVLLRFPAWAPSPERRTGRELAVSGRLVPPDRGALAVRAHATLRVDTPRATGGRRNGLAGVVDGVRDRGMAALAHGLPAADGALLQGMVLGQDGDVPETLEEDLRAAGLAHLTAASGSNVLLLAALVMAVGALLGLPIRPRLVVVLGLIALYVPLAGAGPSIQRAGVMGAAGLVATLASRPGDRAHAVLLAAAVTLGLEPRASGDPGWQMSFAAVVALALLAGPVSRALRRRRLPRAVAEATAVALVATLATAPLAAAHFGRTSAFAVPANVAVAPVVAPVMWLGMTSAAAAQALPAGAATLPAQAAAPLVAYVRWVGEATARRRGAEVDAPAWLVALTGAALLVPLAALARRDAHERRRAEQARDAARGGVLLDPVGPPPRRLRPATRRALAVVTGAALAATWLTVLRPPARAAPPADGVLRLTFLDVGQGDATLVQAGDAAVLVDAGPAGAPIVAALRRAGVERLDALVVSHDAADHLGGAPAVLHAFPTALLLDGRDADRSPAAAALDGPLAARGTRVLGAHAGQVLRAGPLRLRVLWPPPAPHTATDPVAADDPNDRAVVLEVAAGTTTALLPADAESDQLLAAPLEDVDVLKVSHHGSADTGLAAVLHRTTPEVAVVSAGRPNPYGHPAPSTLATLAQAVSRTARTDDDGTIVVEGRRGGLHVGGPP
ncbi:ComEC/Rec2 family competence protein [Conexibacter sp. SYSU D00693]|uniref:ComEC/Rec2 family competence protein n=1 Tax=Conexibacter sp. SYSU D00693 TaxID=2812560 RepID=UPI00196BABFE|nr:ComEC/Rec2 family competence protein [Conexibacter sp. SYSU D00693]